MKRILFASYSLDIGGIETALVTLLNYLANNEKYEITLVLEKKQGIFLDTLNENIKIIEYTPSNSKNRIYRKIRNVFKRLIFIGKYKNKFDFSASFATYSFACSFVARTASKNNALWVHTNYLELYKNEIQKFREFFYSVNFEQFKKIIFVSKKANKDFLNVFPQLKQKAICCNNLINDKEIKEKAEETIDLKKEEKYTTFLNVGRHSEEEKKLTRIIYACEKLKKQGFSFKVIFVGDGKDRSLYENLVNQIGLQKNFVFMGKKENPYPYFKISDAIISTSEYEGYPVVFLEAMILEKPIITTEVSDAKEDIEGKFGVVTKKQIEDIYLKMRDFIQNGYEIKKQFDIEKYNKEIKQVIDKIINKNSKLLV